MNQHLSHLSEEQMAAVLAGQAGREVASHAKDCPDCAREVANTRYALTLFRDSAHQCADYWEKRPLVRGSRTVERWAAIGAAVAATILGAVIVCYQPPPQVAHPRQVFTQIPYVVPPAPYERTAVVRMNVPVAALIAAGLRMELAAADSVSADVLVGQDGRPLAVASPENNQ